MPKHPDVFIELANATGKILTLRRRQHKGFVFYYPEEIQTYNVFGRNRLTGEPKKVIPGNLRQARLARRIYVEEVTNSGRTVKGVQRIEQKMIAELGIGRFMIGDPLREILDVTSILSASGFVAITGLSINYIDGVVYCPKDFEDLAMSKIHDAINQKRIFLATPKDGVEEI